MSIDINAIAQALNTSKRSAERRANKEAWAFKEESVRGGKKRMYALASLPKAIRDAILTHKVSNLPPAGVSTISPASSAGPTSPAPFYSVATLDIDHCTSRQREESAARHTILRKLDELQQASGSSREVAMNTMLTMARAGTLAAYKAQLTAAAKVVEFNEHAKPGTEKTNTVEFSAPAGFTVDSERLAQHNKALAYASEHKVSYAEALAAAGE